MKLGNRKRGDFEERQENSWAFYPIEEGYPFFVKDDDFCRSKVSNCRSEVFTTISSFTHRY